MSLWWPTPFSDTLKKQDFFFGCLVLATGGMHPVVQWKTIDTCYKSGINAAT